MMMSTPSSILLATVLVVICFASLVYARALHNQTGVPDLDTVFGSTAATNEGENMMVSKDDV